MASSSVTCDKDAMQLFIEPLSLRSDVNFLVLMPEIAITFSSIKNSSRVLEDLQLLGFSQNSLITIPDA
jgi:hypothetical protein